MSNSDLPKDEAIANRVEGGVRKFFERLGGALDFALRRPLNPQPRTDVTALIPPLERAIEAKLCHEGEKVIAPNLIELRYDYETYQQLTNKRIEYLERELRLSVYEYIHNRRYTTRGEVQVKLAYDMFTRRLTIKAEFPEEAPKPIATQAEAATQAPAAQAELALKSKRFELRAKAANGARISVGRTHDNVLVIEDSTVSSVHAAFTLAANGTLYVTDLGSSNGTFVNGVQIAMGDKTIVRNGDTLRFGEVEVTLEFRSS
ncbi:MAG TPA: FHA domain-containing protein [Blastocatellia bacterium]|nr:FHA domain-containing protein [Blastocatellia bacterium]